jgi:deazaflavin-dependent oxidoreductase (nitroreductase family)
MWFMNKIANPFVCMILRSPLHGMMSAVLLLITYRGRKSGKEYTLPVQYVQDGNLIYIIPGMPDQKTWWRNLRGGALVQIRLAGKLLSGKADVLDGSAHTEQIARVLEIYLRRFPGAAKMHNVRTGQAGSFNQPDLRQAACSTVVVQVGLDF